MKVRELLADIVSSGAALGAAAAWGDAERLRTAAVGGLTGSPEAEPVTDATLFDLASLTKPIVVGSVCMVLADQGMLDPWGPVDAPWAEPGLRYDHLLRHDSGAPGYCDLEAAAPPPLETLEHVLRLPPGSQRGGAPVYSCIGYIRLADALRLLTGKPIDELFREHVATPMGLGFRYLPDPKLAAPTAAWEPWRRAARRKRGLPRPGPWIQGEPHDPLAWLLGGVSGNAGLFGSAVDVGRYGQRIVQGQASFTEATWLRFIDPRRANADRVLGWHLRSPEGSSAGRGWGSRAVGHTGYTGTSLWIEPEKRAFAALLTASVHPYGDPVPVRRFRAPFSEAALSDLGLP
jgi:CubicO group peptidase (beta-lactamase class C family)